MNKNCFAKRLHQKLPGSELGEFSDGSAAWVKVDVGNNQFLEIGFNGKGEIIEDIQLFKDIIGVVNTVQVFKKKLK